MSKLTPDDLVTSYLKDYEFRGDGGDYTPTEDELALLIDALHGFIGLLEEKGFLTTPAVDVAAWVPASALDRLHSEGGHIGTKTAIYRVARPKFTPLYAHPSPSGGQGADAPCA